MLPIGLLLPIKCYEVLLSKDQINVGNDIAELTIYESREDVNLFLIYDDDCVLSAPIITNLKCGILTIEQAKQIYSDYQSMDESQFLLAYGRDPFEIKKIPHIDIIQKLLEEN